MGRDFCLLQYKVMDIVAHLHFPHVIISGVSSECAVFYCVLM